MINQQKPQRVKSRRTPAGWVIELDSASWANLMTALTVAADHDPERTQTYKQLRSAMSKG